MKKLLLIAFLAILPVVLWAQHKIDGIVKDKTDNVMPGVTIQVKGTSTGAVTDETGKFSLQASSADTLIASFIGYQDQVVPVGNQTSIEIVMIANEKSLNEVVVVGYGKQKKVTVTGSVAEVGGTDLQKSPSVNLSNSLSGRLAGVSTIQSSGEPGYDGSAIH